MAATKVPRVAAEPVLMTEKELSLIHSIARTSKSTLAQNAADFYFADPKDHSTAQPTAAVFPATTGSRFAFATPAIEVPLSTRGSSYRSLGVPEGAAKILSWNVAGLRAVLRDGVDASLINLIRSEQPAILCLQETKIQPHLEDALGAPFAALGYTTHWSHAEQAGYSGPAA